MENIGKELMEAMQVLIKKKKETEEITMQH